MKIVFMGTPDFASGALQALTDAGYEVLLAVTQPDKPKGRSGKPSAPPVKEKALSLGIPVFQPEKIRTPDSVERLRKAGADIFIVAAFGQILSREILDIPQYGCLNIHASLLPRYRGTSPIQHAILDGEEKTGITIMQMDEGIDTGDMLYKKELPILETDDYLSLHDKLTRLGGEAIVEALELLKQGKLTPEKQRGELSCYAPLIKKSMGRVDFNRTPEEICRAIRAMTPWPGAFTEYRGKQLKIWRAEPERDLTAGQGDCARGGFTPGEIIKTDRDCVTVAAGEGAIRVYELQLEGKKRMSARDFLSGAKMRAGEILGDECK